jgi:F-type H+-transporting ATPase subunit delta
MREPTIARNYADVLVTLAERAKALDAWGKHMDDVAEAVSSNERLRRFLASPRVTTTQKAKMVGKAFGERLPKPLVAFLKAVIMHRRQHLLSEISIEYHTLVDAIAGRAHAQVQMVRLPDEKGKHAIAKQLSRITGLTVVPHFTVRPQILGGAVVKMGDTVMDGSLARRLELLRMRMLGSAAR